MWCPGWDPGPEKKKLGENTQRKSHKDLHANVNSIIHNSQMSNNGWINTMGCIWTMKYYSAIRRKEILKCVPTWWTLENTLLSEWATCKSPYILWFHLCEMSSLGQSIETESGCLELRGEGGGQGWEVRTGLKLKGMISLWDNENVLIDVSDKHTILWVY